MHSPLAVLLAILSITGGSPRPHATDAEWTCAADPAAQQPEPPKDEAPTDKPAPHVLAPQNAVLALTYLVAGKNINSFTDEEEENYAKADVPFMLESALTKQGAIFHKTKPWAAFSVADGTVVTGQNPASAKGVAEKMIGVLGRGQSFAKDGD